MPLQDVIGYVFSVGYSLWAIYITFLYFNHTNLETQLTDAEKNFGPNVDSQAGAFGFRYTWKTMGLLLLDIACVAFVVQFYWWKNNEDEKLAIIIEKKSKAVESAAGMKAKRDSLKAKVEDLNKNMIELKDKKNAAHNQLTYGTGAESNVQGRIKDEKTEN